MQAPDAAEVLLRDSRHGRKNGRGFYVYEKGKKKDVDHAVYDLLGGKARGRTKIPRDEVRERVVLQMVNEAARCLEEGIIRSPRDGDVGAVFGLGAFRHFAAGRSVTSTLSGRGPSSDACGTTRRRSVIALRRRRYWWRTPRVGSRFIRIVILGRQFSPTRAVPAYRTVSAFHGFP